MSDEQPATEQQWPPLAPAPGRSQLADGTSCRVAGEGPPVVLLHGIGLDQTIWRDSVTRLRDDFCVITYDLLGHGDSPSPNPADGLAGFSRQLGGVLRAFEVERAALVGHALGALVAQHFAIHQPGLVARLALLNSVFERDDETRSAVLGRVAEVERRGAEALVEHALSRWISADFRSANPGLIARLKIQLAGNESEGFVDAYRIFAAADLDLAGRLAAIRAPTLVLTGELDAGATPGMSRAIAAAIPGARFGIAPGMRHLMLLEAATSINRTLHGFLRG